MPMRIRLLNEKLKIFANAQFIVFYSFIPLETDKFYPIESLTV